MVALFTMSMSSEFFLLRSIVLCFCISVIAMTSSAIHMHGNETDRAALLAFKGQISADSVWVLSSWNTSSHFCEWVGVTCGRRHDRVIELNLDYRELTGSVSPYLGNLSFLRSLDLSNNMLYGHIPQEVGRLSKLQNLAMNNNSLSGALPFNLSQCFNLRNLEIDRNNLTGRIPDSYGSFRKLIVFSLSSNHLSGGIPVSLGNLSSTGFLRLNFNNLTGSIPDSLSQLTKLLAISISVNNLYGKIPPSFFNISSLIAISIPENQLIGSLPQDIGLKLPKLHYLYIGGNQFSGSIPISLFTNISQLLLLSLSVNKFSGPVPVEIGKQKSLQRLHLGFNSFGSGGNVHDLNFLTSLNNCTSLQELYMRDNNLGGKLPLSITNLSSTLTKLDLGYNKIFGSIPLDIGKLENLRELNLPSNFLTGGIPVGIGKLRSLQQLYLDRNSLSGKIPSSLGILSSLSYLDLSHNFLEGNIIASYQNCRLQELTLDHNHLTGIIPNQVFESCRQLIFINLSRNYFFGPLPVEVGNLNSLMVFNVYENKLSGPIPTTLGSCSSLQELNVHGNFFHGEIPSSFRNLINIEYIDLSRNNLSGQIPKDLGNLLYLQRLNLSFNNFEGGVPTQGIFLNTSAFFVHGNDRLCGGVAKLHLPICPLQKSKKKTMSLLAKMTLGIIVPSIFAMASLLILLFSRKRSGYKTTAKEFANKLPRISYRELYDATSGFSSEMLIGMGSYGSVFKGVLREYETVIAVKVFNLMAKGASKNFVAECETPRRVRHRNLLKILTVCSSVDYIGSDFKALVFEFMSNENLESWLHPTLNGQYPSRNMNFLQRLNIAIDIALALDYLHNHFGTAIVHCDLKPSNVLLNEDMVACLGDFGLAKFLTKSIPNSGAIEESNSISLRGTIGYIPPEYGMGVDVSTEGDVYSYGILILEMFTGKRPTDPMFNSSITLRSFCEVNLTGQVMEILDTRLLLEETPRESPLDDIEEQLCMPSAMSDNLVSVMKIGVACSSEVVVDRMEIKDVLMKLHAIKDIFIGNGSNRDM